ncbi:M56 family metallopeptidase [Spirosoma harenae]
MSTLDYFLKANLYGLLFVSCYWLLLRRHTFFNLNRAYLLLSAVASLVLPLVSLSTQTVETLPVPVGVIALPASVIVSPVETGPDWEQIGLLTYGAIALLLSVYLFIRTTKLLRFIKKSPRQQNSDHVLVQPDNSQVPTFSFFQYLVLNPDDRNANSIIEHELVHIRQYHSIDVVGLSLLRAIFWACPALWLIDRMLRQVHEFLADKVVSKPANYAHFLVNYAFGTQANTLVNSFFNPSLLKQRIIMLQQKSTTRWALGKYILVLPLALGLLAMTTAREEITEIVGQVTEDTITVSGKVTSAEDGKPLPGVAVILKNGNMGTTTDANGSYKLANVPKTASLVFSFVGFESSVVDVHGRTSIYVTLAAKSSQLNEVVVAPNSKPQATHSTDDQGEVFLVVEQVPEFPGGMQALSQYLARNLRYPKEAQQNRIQGRVFVKFVVSQQGDIQDLHILKGIGSGCDEEAVRVISQMPKWKPGRQQGRAVAVQYNLPINFQLEKSTDKRTGQLTPQSNPSEQVGATADNFLKQPFDSTKQSSTSIRFRGNRFSEGDPLYIIDGVEVPKGTFPKDGLTEKNNLNLSPNDIESVTVLKDGSAAATYGEKGKNGVILITTKKK